HSQSQSERARVGSALVEHRGLAIAAFADYLRLACNAAIIGRGRQQASQGEPPAPLSGRRSLDAVKTPSGISAFADPRCLHRNAPCAAIPGPIAETRTSTRSVPQ